MIVKKSAIRIGRAVGAVACLLFLSGYLLYRGLGLDWPWNGPEESVTEQPRIDHQGARDVKLEASDGRAAAETTGYPYARGSTGFNPLDLLTAAQSDPRASEDLAFYIRFCSRFIVVAAEGKPDDRYKHPAWARLLAGCDQQTFTELTASLATVAKPESEEWQAFMQAVDLPPTLKNLAERDRAVSAILETSQDPELIGNAAVAYFDRDRIHAWAGSRVPATLAQGDVSYFVADLAQTIACRSGRDCSPFALGTLHECASMAACRPGTSLEQIIRLRRSPQEMALIDEFAGRILKSRSRWG